MYCATPASRRDSRANVPSRRRFRAWLALAGAALALTGCSGDSGGADAATAHAEIGTGMFEFERLVEGQPLELYAGPQGGHHFLVHARMRGLTPGDPRQPGLPGNPTTFFRVLDENGERVDIPEVRQLGYTPDPRAGGWYALPSGRILLIDNLLVRDLYGQTVTIEMEIRDAEGRSAGDSVRVMALAYPPDAGPGRDIDAGPGRVDAAPLPPRPDAGPPEAAALDAPGP